MKNKDLYQLKQTLYPIYEYLKSDLTTAEIDNCQFFDIKPSQLTWDFYLSKTEQTIRQFGKEICLIKRFNQFDNDERRNQILLEIFEKDDLIQLFMDRENSILLPKELLIKALESLHFFQNSNYILVSLTSKNIVSGASSGFILWQKKKSIMDYAGAKTSL